MPPALRKLVAFLALRGTVNRQYVAGTLWPGTTDLRAGANLRTNLWRLHQICVPLVESWPDSLSLGPAVRVDVQRWTRDAQRCLASPADALGLLYNRESLGTELLPGWYEDWVEVEREHIRQLRLHLLERAARDALSAKHFGAAIELALTAMRIDPLRESAHRLVVQVHLAEGNISEALRQYRSYAQLLRAELGVPPSELFTRIIRDSIGEGRAPGHASVAGARRGPTPLLQVPAEDHV